MAMRRRRWPWFLGSFLLLVLVGLLLFRWDWLIPLVNAQASAALGRPVRAEHLHVALGNPTRVELDGITVENPADWPGAGNLATIERLGIDLDPMAYIRHREIVVPVIDVQSPKVEARQLADGKNNYTFSSSGGASGGGGSGPGPKLGTLRIADGHAHVVAEKLKGDFNIDLATEDSKDGTGQIKATTKGTYAKAPITSEFVGGALLSLRDASTPYPVNFQLANGGTRISLVGTVQNPLAFAGTNLKLELSGPDMSLLLPLTGIAIPKTPPYRVAGQLDYADGVVKFDKMAGRVGSSDLEGNIHVDTRPQRPVLDAALRSQRVDLKDLGGFIGAQPGDADKGTKKLARTDGKVLPNDPISLPKLTVADVHLDYHANRIEGRDQPLDNMRAKLDIVDGAVSLQPLSFGIGKGEIAANINLDPVADKTLHAKASVDFKRVDFGKLIDATGVGKGTGVISGRAVIDGTGNSMATVLARGNGELRVFMGPGGDVSALLVDLSGLQLGNAILSAIGVPTREKLMCFVADLGLVRGQMTARTVLLDTDSSRVGITGGVNMATEGVDLRLETVAKHFSIGTIRTPIGVGGTLGKPSIMPEMGPLAARGGAAVGLSIVGTPLAGILATVDFGTGEDNACASLMQEAKQGPRKPAGTAPAR